MELEELHLQVRQHWPAKRNECTPPFKGSQKRAGCDRPELQAPSLASVRMHAKCGYKSHSLRALLQDNQLTGGLPPLWGGWGEEGLPALRVLNLSNNPLGARSRGWLAKVGPLPCRRTASAPCAAQLVQHM